MYCMKCGREISEEQTFCDLCLEEMDKYPVKPGIAVQLPSRKETPAVKKVHVKKKQPPTAEEQVLKLKKRIRRLLIAWLVTLLLLAATIYPAVEFLSGHSIPLPGQNYSTITGSSQP